MATPKTNNSPKTPRPKKKQLPSKAEIRRILNKSVFNPRDVETPLHVISTTAGRDYHINRGMEMVREAVDAIELSGEIKTFHEKMQMALSLMALGIAEAPPLPAE